MGLTNCNRSPPAYPSRSTAFFFGQWSDADALFEAALKEDLLFAPGSIFPATGGLRSFLRLNGSLAGPTAENAVRRIGELAAAL